MEMEAKLSRLTPLERREELLLPWRRAYELTGSFLYWLPVDSFPAPVSQRAWLLQFFQRWSELLTRQSGLREEIFLQFKLPDELQNPFMNSQQEFFPILGLSRRPGAKLPSPPTVGEIQSMSKAVLERAEPVDVHKYMADYCYWLSKKLAGKQRAMFLGHGVLTIAFMGPDPDSVPPDLPPELQFLKKRREFKLMDFEGALATAFSMTDSFMAKSKLLFGAGLEDEPQFKGLMYILPLLSTADFFSQPAADAEKWFQFCDVYINESRADKGILMAFKNDFEEQLVDILRKMKEDGFDYLER